MNFLVKNFSKISLFISLIILSYIFYKSEIYWSGDNYDYYKSYYLIIVTAIIFSILSFYFSKNLKKYLIIIFLSILFSLYLFEFFLSIKTEKKMVLINKDLDFKKKIFKEKFNEDYDTRKKIEVYLDEKKKDNQIAVQISTATYLEKDLDLLPVAGISKVRTIYCNENGYYPIYLSDRYGFNNPDVEWESEQIEFLLVGDSFVHGACVNRPNDISSVLRIMSKSSVLNLGYDGHGPLTQYITLREYFDKNKKVKNVLWFYYENNDLGDLNNALNSKIYKKYLDDLNFLQNLRDKQDKIDQKSRAIINSEISKVDRSLSVTNKSVIKKKSFNIRSFLKLYKTRLILIKPPLPKEFREIIKLANDLTIENESKLTFIYLPEFPRYQKNYKNQSYEQIKKLIKDLNINFIDIHELVFKKEDNPLIYFPFQSFGHYNIEGYKRVAEEILITLKN